MTIQQRPFLGDIDVQAMVALSQAFPTDNLHITDLPYRFSSWAFDVPENVAIWVDDADRIVAWAAMQTPFWSIDYAYDPNADPQLHQHILTWVDQRASDIVNTPSGRPIWFVNPFADQLDRMRDLVAAGFADQSDVGDMSWSKVWMQRSGEMPVANAAVADGFTIRPLADQSEAAAYVALHRAAFDSDSMTVEWRTRTITNSAYVADIDLVVAAPDGQLAAFCICWLHKSETGETFGQIEPLGVLPDFQKLGLGRAILLEGIRRLQGHGASQIYIETDNYRDAAFALYESVGFQVIREVLVFRKDYGEL